MRHVKCKQHGRRTKTNANIRAASRYFSTARDSQLNKNRRNEMDMRMGRPSFLEPRLTSKPGVAILVSPRFKGKITKFLNDLDGRIVAIQIEHDNIITNVMNVYAPTLGPDRKAFFDNLWHYKTGDNNIILSGDFNCIENTLLDKVGGNPLATYGERLTHKTLPSCGTHATSPSIHAWTDGTFRTQN